MYTRYRRATTVSAPVSVDAGFPTNCGDTNNLATSLADASISVSIPCSFTDSSVPAFTAVTTVSELLRPGSPVDPAPDTPTITRILLSTLEGVQSGVPTLTTPTLTPTTLRNIQQTFLQASASQQPQPPETHTNQAGFVPPFVHPQPGSTFISIDSKSLGGGIATLVDTSNYSSANDESGTLAKTSSGPPPLLPISNILTTAPSSAPLPGPTSSLPTIISTAPISTSPMPSVSLSVYSSDSDTLSLDAPPSRRMGGRRPNNHEKLSEEEEIKRRVRRERNKMAAARCRKRRLDQTMTLQEETDHLAEKRSALQQEVTMLTQQKEELEFLLATHKAVCTKASCTRVPSAPSSSVIVTTSSRTGTHTINTSGLPVTEAMFIGHDKGYLVPSSTETQNVRVKEENLSDSEDPYSSSLFNTIIPTTSSLSHVVTYSSSMPPTAFGSARSLASGRPTRPTSLAVAPLTELGVAIETPSAGLRGLNFESMMEGGTGLTPVTPLPGGMPTSLSTGLTPLTTPIMPHPSASNNNNNSSTQCGYQQRSSSSELSSPDSMSSKQLVSL